MNQNAQIQMMERCVEEIRMLRMRIDDLAPKAHAYDTLGNLVRLLSPKESQGYGEDILWRLQKTIEQEKADMVKPPADDK
jgi:hypothetical protein